VPPWKTGWNGPLSAATIAVRASRRANLHDKCFVRELELPPDIGQLLGPDMAAARPWVAEVLD
jgi:hypothetical protein